MDAPYAQLAPGLLDKLIKNHLDIAKPTASPKLEMLTQPEQQVLHLIAKGSTNRDIAKQLFITEGTVQTHVTHLLSQLDCRNRAQLAIVANSIFGTNATE